MKTVKLMLLSLSLLAVVGGSLAFIVKVGPTFCTAVTILDANGNVTYPAFCPNIGKIRTGHPTDNVATTTTSGNVSNPCPATLACFTTNPGKTID